MAYLVGWNLPGCLPDSVSVYPTREAAVEGMITELEYGWDAAYRTIDREVSRVGVKAALMLDVDADFLAAQETFSLSVSGDVSHTMHDVVYWIQACECDTVTGVTCDTCDEHAQCLAAPF